MIGGTTRRRALRGLAALSLLGAATVAVGMPASGQEATDDSETFELPQSYLDAYGWWSKAQQNPAGGQNPNAPVPLPLSGCTPTPTSQCAAGPPNDGLYVVYDYDAVVPGTVTGPVANAPVPALPGAPAGTPLPNVAAPTVIGPTAFAAARYIVPEGAETQLSLQILSRATTQPGGVDPSAGQLFACSVTTPGWAAAQNGRYDQGPKYDCTTADEADLQGDRAVFDLGPAFVQNGTIDIAFVGGGTQPFQMALAAPEDADLMIVSAPELDAALDDFTFEDPAAAYDESLLTDDFGTADLEAGEFAVDDSYGALAAAPAVRPRVPGRQIGVAAGVANPFRPDASRGERLMAVSLLLLLAVALWWVGGQPTRLPRLLGSLGAGAPSMEAPEIATRGIGRFSRVRGEDRPPRLF